MLYDPKWAPAETTTEEWRTVLHLAATLLETKGWCTGNLQSTTGRMCALGALWIAEGNEFPSTGPQTDDAYKRSDVKGTAAWHLRQWLRAQKGDNQLHIFEWNDDQNLGKTVINTMRKVADAV